MTQRAFDLQDQLAFAELSGDFNPIHVDAIYARRQLYGKPVVHGIHATLWALNQALRGREICDVTELNVKFINPILVDAPVTLEVEHQDEDGAQLSLNLRVKGQLCVSISVLTCPFSGHQTVDAKATQNLKIQEHEIESFADLQGKLDLYFEPSLARSLFPHLTETLAPKTFALMLASTRLVGMVVPGLHSIYNQLRLTKDDEEQGETLSYQVKRVIPKFRRLTLNLAGAGFKGIIESSIRPAPQPQLLPDQVRDFVADADTRFAARRCLIIGGSRGLGEATALLLAAKGAAEVLITYHKGRDDAELVREAAESLGAKSSTMQYDASQPLPASLDVIKSFAPTDVFYFATPHIGASSVTVFDEDRFNTLMAVYVHGFQQLLLALKEPDEGEVRVFYPSSIYVSEPEQGMLEYAAAKSAGETFCRYFNQSEQHIQVLVAQLPRVQTDQTASLTPKDSVDPVTTMTDVLDNEFWC